MIRILQKTTTVTRLSVVVSFVAVVERTIAGIVVTMRLAVAGTMRLAVVDTAKVSVADTGTDFSVRTDFQRKVVTFV